jgi:hypothetical protein
MATLYWLLVSIASLMTISTLVTGLFAWRMWARPARPARIGGSAPPGEPVGSSAIAPSRRKQDRSSRIQRAHSATATVG